MDILGWIYWILNLVSAVGLVALVIVWSVAARRQQRLLNAQIDINNTVSEWIHGLHHVPEVITELQRRARRRAAIVAALEGDRPIERPHEIDPQTLRRWHELLDSVPGADDVHDEIGDELDVATGLARRNAELAEPRRSPENEENGS